MHAKNNRQNSAFQIAYFLAGSCHTPDGAYALLCDLRQDRALALAMVESSTLRASAKRILAEAKLEATATGELTPEQAAARLEALADLSEREAFAEMERDNYAAALQELADIDKCLAALQPLRKYGHLPDPKAHASAQQEEWKLELVHRAENYILTGGSVPADHFATMRMHPEFESYIMPQVLALTSDEGRQSLLARLTSGNARAFQLPLLED